MAAEDTSKAGKATKKPQQPAGETDRVERPDREELDTQLKALNGKIDECKAVIDGVKAKLDKRQEERKNAEAEQGGDEEAKKLKKLREVTQKLSKERKGIFEEFNRNKEQRQKVREAFDNMLKVVKNAGGCSTLDQVEKKIRDLEYYLSTTDLSLKEEKAVIADIKNLGASREVIGETDAMKKRREELDKVGKDISARLDANKKLLDVAKAAEDKQYHLIQGKRKANKDQFDAKALIESRNAAWKEMNKHYDQIRKLRDEFKKKDNAWRKMMDEKRKERKERERREQETYREEQRIRKLQEEEENAESMHADKFASIEQLRTVLTKLTAQASSKPAAEEEAQELSSFAEEGRTLIGKAANKMDDDIFGTKKAGKKKAKKGGKGKKKAPGLTFDLNILQEFETLKISAPLTVDAIPETFELLDAKRAELVKDKEKRHKERLAKLAQLEKEKEVKDSGAAPAEGATEDKAAEGAASEAKPDAEAPAAVEATA